MKAVMVLLNVMKIIIINIFKVVKKIINIILDIVNIIVNVGSVVFNFLTKFDINFDKISCNINFIVKSFDPCKVAIGIPLKAIFGFIGRMFDKLLSVLSVAVKGFGKVLKRLFGPVITFVMKIITSVLTPVVELITAVFALMKDVADFFINFFTQDSPFDYMYWKMLWSLQENIPWLPIEAMPLILSMFYGLQFIGGLAGVYKVLASPLRIVHGSATILA